jgi:hypothetical protein
MGWTNTRARIAASRRHHPDRDTSGLERRLRAEHLADTITRALADTPLTGDERRDLAVLILAAPDTSGGAA